MRTKDSGDVPQVAPQPEEARIRAVTPRGDPALGGVIFLVFEMLSISAVGEGGHEHARRLEGLFRFAARPVPPGKSGDKYMDDAQRLLAGIFGSHEAMLLVQAWPFVRDTGAAYESYRAGRLTLEKAFFQIFTGANAVLVAGAGVQGQELLFEMVAPVLKKWGSNTKDELLDLLGTRPLKPRQLGHRGDIRKLRAFLKQLVRNRLVDSKYESSTVREYERRGLDVSTEEAIQAVRDDGARRRAGVSLGYYSARGGARALGMGSSESSFRLAVRRARADGKSVGKRLPPSGRVQYSASDLEIIERYKPRDIGSLKDVQEERRRRIELNKRKK